MSLVYPFWFKQRQCKAEPQGGSATLEVTGPNLPKAYLHVAPAQASPWLAALRTAADGSDVTTAEAPTETAAWDAAFELYRTHFIV